MSAIRVCVAGVTGWTGRAVAEGVVRADDMELVAAVARKTAGQPIASEIDGADATAQISATVAEALQTPCDILVEYTSATAAKANVLCAIDAGVSAVIGSSGLTAEDFAEIEARAQAKKVGVIAAGNFSLTAALLKHFALIAAKHIPHWEILDYAYEGKPDAPSGTTRELAEAMAEVRANEFTVPVEDTVGDKRARGAQVAGTPVHSLRLPGYVLSFETQFGLPNERLTMRHDAGTGAEPYVGGTLLATRRAQSTVGLVRGLDTLLFG